MLNFGPEPSVPRAKADPLAPIRQRFLLTVETHKLDVAKLLRKADEPSQSRTAMYDIGMIAHRVAGVAATLGFGELGRVAAELDQKIGTAMKAELFELGEFNGTVALFQAELHKAQAPSAA